MRNDDIIQSIRYMLDIDDVEIAQILKLRGYRPKRGEVADIVDSQQRPESEKGPDYSQYLMAQFLNGLIYYKSGKNDDDQPRAIKNTDTNKMVLKKMRVAFKLRENEMHEVLEQGGFSISRHEMSALFRREGHKNYRECGDQILRYFLKGLTKRLRY